VIILQPASQDRQPIQFRSYSAVLRWLVTNMSGWSGVKPSLSALYLGSRDRNGTVSGGALYQVNQRIWSHKLTAEQHVALIDLLRRYGKFVHYLTEIEPQWEVVQTIPYMDNSVEEVQQDKRGNRRRVTAVAPHGDACF
jgi:hypothetical protein